MDQATHNTTNITATTRDMLTEEDALAARNNQHTFELQVCEQIKIAATMALKELLAKGETSLDLTSIHQSPDEHFQVYLTCLLQASGSITSDTEASRLITQQLAFKNANKCVKRL